MDNFYFVHRMSYKSRTANPSIRVSEVCKTLSFLVVQVSVTTTLAAHQCLVVAEEYGSVLRARLGCSVGRASAMMTCGRVGPTEVPE